MGLACRAVVCSDYTNAVLWLNIGMVEVAAGHGGSAIVGGYQTERGAGAGELSH